jgi:pimeloyl-ACP methyl ester carboxylesterase
MFKWLFGILGLIVLLVVGAFFVLKRDDIPYATLAAKYENGASRYVDLPGGVHMHYRDEGATQAPGGPPVATILLIHGFSASTYTWQAWTPKLGNLYRVVSIDLPGHGLTQAPAGYRASIENFRDAVYAFTQAQHLTRFAIAGNSMGGNVAWEYALAHPEQLDALILVDAAGWPHPSEGALNTSPMMQALRNPILGPIVRDLDNTRIFRQGLEAAFADPAKADEAMVTRYVEMSRAPGHRDILLQLQTNYAGRRKASDELLSQIHTPTLILWGRQDHLIPVADAERFHHAIPGSEVKIFDASGHVPEEEAPDQSATAVIDFLQHAHQGDQRAAGATSGH